uniref:Uncharacterized protein n=1 Tax=Chondria sp. (in: red algae) TaxID=1982705 RepID=A0A1Z1MDI6_9FLOR|nr:hypothetical protein [Chondria sp. (in: red algae)]
MQIFHNMYINKYIYSPVSKFHQIHDPIKIHSIYYILLIGLYFNSYRIILIILIVITLYGFSNSPKLLHTIVNKNIFYLFYTMIINYFIDNEFVISNNTLKYKLLIPYALKLSNNNNIWKIKYCSLFYLIPKYLVKLILTYIIYFNFLEILFIFTEHQIILERLINCINTIYLYMKTEYNKNIINIFLGYHALQNINISLININTGKRIKGQHIAKQYTINFIIIINRYYDYILSANNKNTIILWNRNIQQKSFINLNFY